MARRLSGEKPMFASSCTSRSTEKGIANTTAS
jgi:hypothetical protein